MASRRPALTQVRLVEDGGQALRREVLHSRRRAALEGDGQDPLTAEQEPRLFCLEVLEEGMDGREP